MTRFVSSLLARLNLKAGTAVSPANTTAVANKPKKPFNRDIAWLLGVTALWPILYYLARNKGLEKADDSKKRSEGSAEVSLRGLQPYPAHIGRLNRVAAKSAYDEAVHRLEKQKKKWQAWNKPGNSKKKEKKEEEDSSKDGKE